MADVKVSALTELSVPALEDLFYTVDNPSGTPASRKVVANRIGGLFGPGTCDGRLSLNAGSPVSSDVTSSTGVYFSPYRGNRIALYDGTRWKLYSFSTLSHNLGTVVDATNYDIFVYDNAGTLTLEKTAWANDTTRTTDIVEQDGVWCKSGALTRRYLGTIRTTSTTTTTDTVTRRFVWNVQHRHPRRLFVTDTAAHTYTTAAWRQFNASTANQVAWVVGLNEDPVLLEALAAVTAGSPVGVGIGIDSTTANSGYGGYRPQDTAGECLRSTYQGVVGLGYHRAVWLEYGVAGAVWYTGAADDSDPCLSGQVWA